VSEATNEKLQKCKALLSGEYPEGVDLETLVDELAEAFLDRRDPGRRAERRERRKQKPTLPKIKNQQPGEALRYISPKTRDAVYNRDGEGCTYVNSG
jgi:hypothetical protein